MSFKSLGNAVYDAAGYAAGLVTGSGNSLPVNTGNGSTRRTNQHIGVARTPGQVQRDEEQARRQHAYNQRMASEQSALNRFKEFAPGFARHLYATQPSGDVLIEELINRESDTDVSRLGMDLESLKYIFEKGEDNAKIIALFCIYARSSSPGSLMLKKECAEWVSQLPSDFRNKGPVSDEELLAAVKECCEGDDDQWVNRLNSGYGIARHIQWKSASLQASACCVVLTQAVSIFGDKQKGNEGLAKFIENAFRHARKLKEQNGEAYAKACFQMMLAFPKKAEEYFELLESVSSVRGSDVHNYALVEMVRLLCAKSDPRTAVGYLESISDKSGEIYYYACMHMSCAYLLKNDFEKSKEYLGIIPQDSGLRGPFWRRLFNLALKISGPALEFAFYLLKNNESASNEAINSFVWQAFKDGSDESMQRGIECYKRLCSREEWYSLEGYHAHFIGVVKYCLFKEYPQLVDQLLPVISEGSPLYVECCYRRMFFELEKENFNIEDALSHVQKAYKFDDGVTSFGLILKGDTFDSQTHFDCVSALQDLLLESKQTPVAQPQPEANPSSKTGKKKNKKTKVQPVPAPASKESLWDKKLSEIEDVLNSFTGIYHKIAEPSSGHDSSGSKSESTQESSQSQGE